MNRESRFGSREREAVSGRRSSFLLAAIGCLGVTSQLILLRELMAAFGGNELSAGVTVAAWILCEALGAWLAGLARSSSIVHRSSFLSALSILSSLAAVPAAVLVRPMFGVLPGEALSIPLLLLATFAVVLLPAALHGALFVTAAATCASSIGSAYIREGIGTVLAGLACFLLLNRLPSLPLVALSSLPLAAASFRQGRREEGAAGKWQKWTTLTLGFTGMVALVLLVLGLPVEKLAWGAAWRGQRVTAVINSPYGKIVRLERAGQQLILYDGLPVLTVPTTETERVEELALLPVLVHPAPRRVLVLGSNLAIPAALARFRPDLKVTTVQLDPLLARISLTALMSDSSYVVHRTSFRAPCSLVIADPMTFLRATRDSFDCIILTDDVPSSLSTSRFFSLGFYGLCGRRLAENGALAIAGPGTSAGFSPDVARILLTRQQTLETAFDYVLTFAADFPIFLASDRPLRIVPDSAVSRLARVAEPPTLLDSTSVAGLLDPFRQSFFASQLANRQSPVAGRLSSLAHPRELFLNMVRENRLVSPSFGAFYLRLGGLSLGQLLLFVLVLTIIGIAGARLRGSPFSRGFAIITSGFSGSAISFLLVFAWQATFGSVFSGIALLVAAFMLGTVLGAILGVGRSRVPRPPSIIPFLVADLILAFCALAAVMPIGDGPAPAFLVISCLAGACLGFQFALAGSAATDDDRSLVARRAGVVTALDLIGGSLGGILTALLLVPVTGILAACFFICAVKLASALTQLSARPIGD